MQKSKKVYLIRHAQTQYNVLNQQALDEGKSKEHFKHVPELVDVDLSEYGHEQAKKASKETELLDIELVLVSPMRRALRTATLMFQNHPNKPKFIALPIIRDIFASSCDIPMEFSKIKEEFRHVDFTLIESLEHPRLWFLKTIQEEDILQEIIRAVSGDPEKADYIDIMLKRFTVIKTGNETRLGVRKRAEIIKKSLVEYLNINEKLALVSHYSVLKVLTGTEFNERDRSVNGIKFQNAQVAEWSISTEI